MMRFTTKKFACAWLLLLGALFWAGGALAEDRYHPSDAMNPWTEESFLVGGNVSDIQKIVHTVLSSPLLALDPSISGDLAAFRDLNDQYPVEGFAFGAGIQKGVLRLQLAVSVGPSRADLLSRLATGTLVSEDLAMLTQFDIPVEGPITLEEGLLAYRIPMEGTPFAPHFAARGNLLLVGLRPEDILGSVAALKDPAQRFVPQRRFPDAPNYFLFRDNGFVQLALLASEMPYLLRDNVVAEFSCAMAENEWLLGVFTNLASAIAAPKDLEIFKNIATPLPLLGGGKVLGAMHFTENYDYLKRTIQANGDEEAREGFDEFLQAAQEFGISEEHLRNLLTGSVGMVLGGTASFASAPLPGAYIVLEGQGDSAKAVAEILANKLQEMEMPLSPVNVAGWDVVYSMPLPATFTLAVRGSSLLVGLLDANQLSSPAAASPRLQALQGKSSLYTYFFVDNENLQKEILTFLKGADIWRSILGDDFQEFGAAVLQAHDVLATVQDMTGEFSGLDQGALRLNFFAPDQALEAEWQKMKATWGVGTSGENAPQTPDTAPASGDTPPASN